MGSGGALFTASGGICATTEAYMFTSMGTLSQPVVVRTIERLLCYVSLAGSMWGPPIHYLYRACSPELTLLYHARTVSDRDITLPDSPP